MGFVPLRAGGASDLRDHRHAAYFTHGARLAWRLVAPRGTTTRVLPNRRHESEGVGSYWPSRPEKKVDQRTCLLNQILQDGPTQGTSFNRTRISEHTKSASCRSGSQEKLARRGGLVFLTSRFENRMFASRHSLKSIRSKVRFCRESFWKSIANRNRRWGFARCDDTLAVFQRELEKFDAPIWTPLAKKIIELCKSDAGVRL